MTDPTDGVFRQAMATIAEVAPEPLDLPTPEVSTRRPRATRYALAGFAATVLLVAVGLLLVNRETAADQAITTQPSRPADVVLWQEFDTSGVSLDEVAAQFADWEGIEYAAAWDGAMAHQEYSELFSSLPDLVGAARTADFPDSVRIWVTDGLTTDQLSALRIEAERHGELLGLRLEYTAEEFTPLVVDTSTLLVEDLPLSVATFEIEATADFPGQLTVFGTELTVPDPGRLWILESLYPRDYFENASLDEWTVIPLRGRDAFLREGPLGSVIMWQAEDDPTALITVSGLNLDAPELTAIAETLTRDGDGWRPDPLPNGMTERYRGLAIEPPGGAPTIGLQWHVDPSSDERIVMLHRPMGPQSIELAVFELLAYKIPTAEAEGTVEPAQVRGRPATLLNLPGTLIYLWSESPNQAVELIIGKELDARVVLDSIVELDPAEWEALRLQGLGQTSPVTTIAPTGG